MSIHPNHKRDIPWLVLFYALAVTGLVTWIVGFIIAGIQVAHWSKTFF